MGEGTNQAAALVAAAAIRWPGPGRAYEPQQPAGERAPGNLARPVSKAVGEAAHLHTNTHPRTFVPHAERCHVFPHHPALYSQYCLSTNSPALIRWSEVKMGSGVRCCMLFMAPLCSTAGSGGAWRATPFVPFALTGL